MELISVIIPAYNAEKTIKKCISSICGGGYKNIEVIVINDGSSDNTMEIVNSLIQQDDRIILVNQKNSGVAKARNKGLEVAKGKYIAWCDSDDYVEPKWLNHQYTIIKNNKADIALCRVNRNLDKKYVIETFNQSQAIEIFLEHICLNGVMWNKLFRAELFYGKKFNENISYFEDDLLLWDVLKDVKKIVYSPYQDYNFMIHNNSLMGSPINIKRIENTIFVWKKILKDCEKNYTKQYYHLAKKLLTKQILGCTTLIYRNGVNNDQLKLGYKLLRQNLWELGINNFFHTTGMKNKFLYITLLLNIKISRSFYSIKDRKGDN